MEQPLLLQARQFLLSAALGAALGLHYDLLRGLRRWARQDKSLPEVLLLLRFLRKLCSESLVM